MSITKILTKKVLRQGTHSVWALDHMKSLHCKVKNHTSFVKATSYWSKDYTKIYTISHWKGKGFENWLGSNERANTYTETEKGMYESETHTYLDEIVRTNNIFLL